jgi:hypothetical protein
VVEIDKQPPQPNTPAAQEITPRELENSKGISAGQEPYLSFVMEFARGFAFLLAVRAKLTPPMNETTAIRDHRVASPNFF